MKKRAEDGSCAALLDPPARTSKLVGHLEKERKK
jgi:hypothetical protein